MCSATFFLYRRATQLQSGDLPLRQLPRGPRPRNRGDTRPCALHPHQQLRRRSGQARIPGPTQPHPQEIHVRRRIHNPQRAINRKRIHPGIHIEPLRQHSLKNVSRSDIVLDPLHPGQIIFLARTRFQLQLAARAVASWFFGQRLGQATLQIMQPADGICVGRLRLVPLQIRRRHQQNLLLHVVERQYRVEEHQARLRHAQLVFRNLRQLLVGLTAS